MYNKNFCYTSLSLRRLIASVACMSSPIQILGNNNTMLLIGKFQ